MEEAGGTQLFLVVEAGQSALDRLSAAFAAAPIASVLIVPPGGGTLAAADVEPLVKHAQSKDAAALLFEDADLARRIGADGVHLPHGKDIEDRYRRARQPLGQSAIVGVHAGKSRHDAMVLGEAGADYIAFGVPSGIQDRASAYSRRFELIAWWAEIFEVPCVALDVDSLEDAAALAKVGADFVGITLRPGEQPADVSRRVKEIADVLVAPAD